MKTITKLLILFICYSCVKRDSYELPTITITEPNIITNSSLLKVKAALQQAFNSDQKTLYTFPINEKSPTFIKAYVVSNDAAGNFYKKLVVQDSIISPKAGIEILINKPDLSADFSVGQKIFIKLDGLSVSYNDGQSTIDPTDAVLGKYTLGILDRINVSHIPSTQLKNHFYRSSEIHRITPTIVNLSNLSEEHINTFIQFENAQFEKTEIGKTFSGEPNDEFDGFRYLFDCETQQTIRLQTSTFSSFKSTIIPSKKGIVNAILSKDYTAKFLVAIINTPSYIQFDIAERCDPQFLDCGTVNTIGKKVLFNEDFENIKSNTALLKAGWSNINKNGNSTKYTSKSSGGNRFMDLSAYNSGESPLEVWLVSPSIDLDNSENEILTFDTNTGYDNGKVMNVFVSSNFSGDVSTATWTLLDAVLSEGPSSGYGSNFTNSGNINLSCLTGKIHIAFQYVGSDGGITTTFRIDNIKVTTN